MRSCSGTSRVVGALVSLSLALAPLSARIARAEPTAAELAAARELFEAGLALENKGEWAKALEKFRKVAAVKTTPQVRFHVALCLENTGKLVDALNEFQRAQADTEGATKPDMVTVNNNSAKHIADLKDRIPRITIQLPSGVTTATVTIDGKKVSASLVGTPLPLDPGSHQITVSASEGSYEKTINLVERGAPTTIDVTFTSSEPTPPPDKPPAKKDEPEKPGGGPGVVPFVVGGVGIAVMIGGVVYYSMGRSSLKEVEDACPELKGCSPALQDTYDKGKSQNTIGGVLLVTGGVLTAVGVVLLVLSPGSSETKTTSGKHGFSLSLGPSPAPLGIGLSGAF